MGPGFRKYGIVLVALLVVICISASRYLSPTPFTGIPFTFSHSPRKCLDKTPGTECLSELKETPTVINTSVTTPPCKLPVSDMLCLPDHNTMPYSKYTKSPEDLQRQEWVHRLHDYLLTLNKSVSPQVNMVFSDYNHKELALNWIVAALKLTPPLHNILVMSLDDSLCQFVRSKELSVTCIESPVKYVINTKNENTWASGIKVRLVALRLINYWGYDVASYDSDAVLLKNPQVLYDERPNVHLFSSCATFPPEVATKWGFTLCGGTMTFRASPATEEMWRCYKSADDNSEQLVFNQAIQRMNVKWNIKKPLSERCGVKEGWDGKGSNGFTVHVIPAHKSCRASCCKKDMPYKELYIVHPRGGYKTNLAAKEDILRDMKCWFIGEHIKIKSLT